ncbi:precorrin-6y C5,15-methyltransferase (decarboxylating) subunit CbiE [Tenacibaculum finnmarkense]|uniref:precorrin-6y C5,15-methyltransferase (decarboxylating) subunit CbiE n=1 Tax=Tenacibaculum finnmarkense TaxID=2781243 RepID=UPI001EFBE291|nr:precorrin-6y C5,15-methyltransferase (decarboxylating) subunit CbiE [Tenacibaculum finnmarkense]MCG8235830.1 precorrin-6y C5,15-methyltransferase (decarboxylating) subunit CbiE [Tenacibaculum finnmarkense genomovar ulcerans]MCG8829838.1 precorrin-6y C5,15-methyltransferase (decarboxylating) subunit CbiE [Tenacibaculum finnmarkense]
MTKIQKHIDFYLIGISNHPTPKLNDDVLNLIQESTVFSGGKRHYQLVKSYLPENHTWIEISGKMDFLINKYKKIDTTIVVFASGDPFFYGFGNTLQRLLPNAKLKATPYFNSIQLLCHKTQTNYNTLKSVSVHGRDWSALDEALINRNKLIGILTDAKKTPCEISKRLLKYGFDNYTITVGEALDGNNEHIETLDLATCTKKSHDNLNCVLLKQTTSKEKPFGIADDAFIPLPNRANMITKMPIRLSTINALQLQNKAVFWDIGACTGSVAIEAKQQYPHLKIVAFEKRIVCEDIIQQNTQRFSTPGITIIIDDFFNLNLAEFQIPDVVFIGGHGGRLNELIHLIHQLNPKARIVTNAVKQNSTNIFIKELTTLNYTINTSVIQVNEHNKISIHSAEKI